MCYATADPLFFHDAVLTERIRFSVDGLLSGGHSALIMVLCCGRPEIVGLAVYGPETGLLFPVAAKIILTVIDGGPACGHGASVMVFGR